MTNDQQQVEDWRIEFEATVDCPHLLSKLPSGTYSWESTEWMWAGFLLAKRNQPVIEIPETEWKDAGNHSYQVINKWETFKSITAAGYSYKVK